jgi:endonuclease/exonuclease/phosphatase family metal-dependent hydrolase
MAYMRRFVISLSRIWAGVLLLTVCALAAPSVSDIGNQTVTVGSAISPLPFTLINFAPKQTIRTVAANITSGNSQSYEGPGTRILQGLQPDVAMLQEFNVGNSSSTAEVRAWVNTTFGTGFSYFRESNYIGGIPNGVISRWPIVASGSWDDSTMSNRGFAWARIDIPGDKNLWVVSVHLKASNASDDLTQRQSQAQQLVAYIKANVPSGDFLLIGGDCNTYSYNEACLGTLGEIVDVSAPRPVDQAGDPDTNSGRSSPYDWVLAETELDALETPVQIGSLSFANGLVFDSRVFSPLSLVSPVLSTDSAATNMQHMAIVRAFSVPAAEMLTVTVSSSNTALVPNSNIVVSGTGTSRAVTVTPVANQTGTATITVTGGDGTSTSSDTFVVTVNPSLTAFQSWIGGYGFSGATALASADPDWDGWSNAQEFAFGLVPNVAGGTLVKIENSGTGAKITYLQRSGVRYAVKSSNDLTAWITGLVSPSKSDPQPGGLPSGYEQYEATLTGGEKGFLKVEAVVP